MMRSFVAGAFMLCWISFTAFSQNDDKYCQKPAKKARKYYEQAEVLGFRGDESYFLLKKAVAEDESFAEAYLELAEINLNKFLSARSWQGADNKSTKNFENRMTEYFRLAMEHCPGINGGHPNFVLGEHYYAKRDYVTAKAYLTTYLAQTEKQPENRLREKSRNYLEDIETYLSIVQHPVPFNPVKVRGASTANDEYLPMLSPDNRYLFLTRKQMVNTGGAEGSIEREMFIRCNNNYNGSFEPGIPMPRPFNGNIYQGGSSISVDNKLIFITVVENVSVNGYMFPNGDIYYSEFLDGSWTELKSLGENINSQKIWEGQPSISADNKTLFFSRAVNDVIPGEHYGLMDLYKTDRQPDGSWGKAVNLGPAINTEGNEKSPFIHSDSYTLYFSSDQHVGVGGFDIFYSKMEADGSFQTIRNLGYPINTEGDEHGFIVSTDGRTGYFSSSIDEDGLDIYAFDLYAEARPEQVIFVKGDAVTSKEALNGLEIKLRNVVTQKEVDVVLDKNTGEYVGVIAVKEHEDVLMTAKKDGYAFTSQYISSDENVVGKPVKADIEVKEIKKGETYKINNIVFATNSFDISRHIKVILDEFSEFLKSNRNLVVELHGHTDNVGKAEENHALSENRARSVYEYLISRGVDAGRLSYKGYGQSKPVASNQTAEGRALNRRTEFLVVSE